MLTRLRKRFLDLPISQKFVSIFAVMTLLSCAVMVGALHLGLSVFEEKLYEKSLQELDFFVQRIDDDLQQMDVLTRSIAVDTTIQSQLAQLTAADPETAQYYYLLTGVRPLLLEKLYMSGQADALQFIDLNGNAIVVGQSFPDPGGERRTALLMVAAIMLHNLPEGIAMAAGSENRTMLLIAVAIATHDVPEGICTAAPYLYATHHRAKAFWLSLFTCLPTLLGYGLGRLLWRQVPAYTMGMVTACIAGLMITISCEELIPASPGGSDRLSAMPALMAGVILVLVLRQLLG